MNLTNFQANFKYLIIVGLVLLVLIILAVGFLFSGPAKKGSDQTSTPKTGKEAAQEVEEHNVAPIPKAMPSRVEPFNGQTGISTSPKIIVYFNNSVKGTAISVKVEPSFTFNGSFDSEGKILTVIPTTPLKTNTKYKISLLADNTTIYYWEFITTDKGLSGTEVTALSNLKAKLPYQGDHFWIDYKPLTDKFFVYIDAKPIDDYKKQALAYFVSNGISKPEASLNITFVPVGAAANP